MIKSTNLDYFEKIASTRIKARKRYSYYYNLIKDYCNYFVSKTSSILEIGCGSGELIAGLNGGYKKGIDFSPKMIQEAKKQFPNIDFEIMSAENLSLNQKYDVIILSNLVGYLEDIQAVFNELHKVSHSRTKIIITHYNHLWEPLLRFSEKLGFKTTSPDQNWLSTRDISNLLNLAGFEVYRDTKRILFPIYIPIVSNFINKYLSKLPLIENLALNNYIFAKQIKPNVISENTELLINPNNNVSSKQNDYSVSIVIPTRNESGNIEDAIQRLPMFGREQEIIFIEGNSTDDTWETIQKVSAKYNQEFQSRSIQNRKIIIDKQSGKGKGDAVRKGFEIATGDILMILDADLTVMPEDLPKFFNVIQSGHSDFVMGSRLVYPMEKQAMRFLNMLGNKFFSGLLSWLLDQPISDTLCGTKVIFRDDYANLIENRKFFGDFDPFGDFDLIFGAFKLNLKIEELPIRYQARTYGTTNISRFKHGLILLQMCLFAARKIKFII